MWNSSSVNFIWGSIIDYLNKFTYYFLKEQQLDAIKTDIDSDAPQIKFLYVTPVSFCYYTQNHYYIQTGLYFYLFLFVCICLYYFVFLSLMKSFSGASSKQKIQRFFERLHRQDRLCCCGWGEKMQKKFNHFTVSF